jgi:hypothetical protein
MPSIQFKCGGWLAQVDKGSELGLQEHLKPFYGGGTSVETSTHVRYVCLYRGHGRISETRKDFHSEVSWYIPVRWMTFTGWTVGVKVEKVSHGAV